MTGDKPMGFVLQDRDRRILRDLADMRVMDRLQARAVGGFSSDSRTNRRLHRLVDAGLLRRFSVGTASSGQKALYALSRKGAFAVATPYRGLQRGTNDAVVADYFIAHQLMTNELYCDLKYRSLPSGVTLKTWRWFYKPLTESIRLIPDGYFVVETPHEMVAAFLEIDLGHERDHIWQKKAKNYLRFALSGEFERRSAQKRFDVVVATTSERRVQAIRAAVAALTEKLFWVATLDAIRKEGMFARIWLRPKADERQALIHSSGAQL